MMKFRILPMSSEIAAAARSRMASPQYGHPAFAEIAAGYGPCRVCLRKFKEGEEERLLFTYNAFEGLLEVPLPGPVFIHRESCDRYAFDGFPEELLDLQLLFESYAADGSIVSTVPVERDAPNEQIRELLTDKSTKFINVRNAEAGCHVVRICRDPADGLASSRN